MGRIITIYEDPLTEKKVEDMFVFVRKEKRLSDNDDTFDWVRVRSRSDLRTFLRKVKKMR